MNAAAKVIHQSNLFHGSVTQIRLTGSMFFGSFLVICLFATALAIIFCTNATRIEFSEWQQAEHQTHQLQLEWGQLMLEQASLARPARVAEIATGQLGMVLPNEKNTVILRSR